jgi:signal transduction histidine kinase
VPLRGRRRALGVLVFEDVSVTHSAAPETLEAALELGRQISSAIENTVLFEEVLRSRRELEDTFNSLADFVIVCDRQLRVTHANRAFRARVEPLAGSPLDRRVTELVGSETARWLTALDLTGSEATQAWTLDIDDPQLGGHVSFQVTPLGGPGRAPIGSVIVARDLSEQMRLRAERAALGARLVQSEKLAALGQFVAGVAHELNNPLQGVLGHLELVRATRHVPRDLQSELRVVYRDAERAARIVNNLLVFAGSRRGARRRVNLRTVVARTVSLRGRACRRAGITLTRVYDPDLPYVRGDAMLLQQALLNVIINAEQAVVACAPAEGRIEVRTVSDRQAARAIIEVRDTGPGIPTDALPRLFEPFFTTKEVGKGTGLGLALAYGIVQDHDGEISARNDPRGGAVFRIDLPADTMDARS